MPGLFDSVTPFLSGLRGGVLGSIGSGLANAQNAGQIDQALGPGQGQLMLSNPNASNALYGRQIMQQTYQSLRQAGVPDAQAMVLATHPEAASKMMEPMKLGIGEAPYIPGFGMTGAAPNSQQQQPPSSQPAGPASGGFGPNGMGPMNKIGLIDDDAATRAAKRYNAGDESAVTGGVFSGQLGNANKMIVLNKAAQLASATGQGPLQNSTNKAAFGAYEKGLDRLTVVQTNMGTAQMEAKRLMPMLEKAVNDYYGQTGQFPPINKIYQAVSTNTGDPRVIQIGNYLNALRNTYARGISTRPQGPTVNDKNNFDEVLQHHWAPGQIHSALEAITNEFQAAHDSIPAMKSQLSSQFGFGKDAPDEMVKAAKDAIAKGAPKEKVIQRFQENGFNAPNF